MSELGSLFFYLFLFLVSTIFFSGYKSKRKIVRYIGISVSIILPAVIAGKRYKVGTDYMNYTAIINNIRSSTLLGGGGIT